MVEHYATNLSHGKRIIISALGPLMSLMLAVIALYVSFSFNFHGAVKLCIAIFSFSALVDLRNIYPNPTPIITDNGTITYQDGYRIMLLLKNKDGYTLLNKAYKFYAEENYKEAIKFFEKLKPEFIDETNLSYIIEACRQLKLYSKAKEFYTIILNRPSNTISTEVWAQIGLIESLLGEHKIAMVYYNNSLALDEANIYSLSNRAFTYIQLKQYVEAIRDFDSVIKMQPDYAYAWANKGYAKIKLDLLDDGREDIKYAISIDENEAYAHRAIGVYYFDTKQYRKALESLHLAFELNPDTYGINEEIKMAESKLSAIT